jgi:basic membrane lipoprotein Med (substrate-binding protein (PBP1-ABC) superfamily)
MMTNKRALWQIFILLIVISMIFAGCAPAPKEEAEAPKEEAEAPQEEVEAPPETFKVAFGHVGPTSDEGWTWAHDQGMKAVEAAFPNGETEMVESMPWSDEASRILQQFVDNGAQVVFITSEYADFTYKVSDANPDVMFLECNGHRTTDNLINYYMEHWDPSYLIGMAAGMLTETNKLGYVGSFPTDSVYTSVNSFHLGAQSVNPDVETQVVLINSWFDPAAANQAANTLIDGGADFLFGIMDEAAYLEVAQERGVWAAMWNTDMRRFGEDAYVSSVLLDFTDYYVTEVEAVMDGTWEGNREDATLLPIGHGVDRDPWGKNVPVDIQEKVDEVRDQMINEGLNVFVGPIYDTEGNLVVAEGEELSDQYLYREWTWAVQGVSGMP